MAERAEKIVNAKQLAALVRESCSVKDRTSSITGTFGERVKTAVENGHLNRKAFAVVAGLARMKDDVARDRAIRDIPLYIDMLREQGLFPAEHVGDLVDAAEAADGDEEGGNGSDDAPGPVDDRDPIAAAADKIWNDADPANGAGTQDAPVVPPKPKRGAGMGDAPSGYQLKH
jgi:hypothetical protein